MTQGRRYALAAVIVIIGHVAAFYGFSITGGSGGREEEPSFDVSLVDGDSLMASKITTPSPSAPIPPAPPPPLPQPSTPPTPDQAEADPILDLTEALLRADVSAAPTDLDPPSPETATLSQASASAAALNPGGATCRLTEDLQTALQADPTVLASTRRMPRKAKSVANAVKIWDAGWATKEDLGDASVLIPIQSAVVSILKVGSPACVRETLLGPRLIMVVDGPETTLLVFGSGEWRWADLRPDALGFSSLIQALTQGKVRGKD